MEKNKKKKDEDWKDFLNLPYDTYWSYWVIILLYYISIR